MANSAITLPLSDENAVPSEAATTTSNSEAEAPFTMGKGSKKTGRDRGAVGHGADENITLLSFIHLVPNLSNASETSPEWREVHKKMVEVYLQMSVPPQSSATIHGHFVELCSALKQGIKSL